MVPKCLRYIYEAKLLAVVFELSPRHPSRQPPTSITFYALGRAQTLIHTQSLTLQLLLAPSGIVSTSGSFSHCVHISTKPTDKV